eukprot:ANDGO_05243.mRNA.1 Heme oxygenase 1
MRMSTLPDSNDKQTSLSTLLKLATADVHAEAESHQFMKRLLGGKGQHAGTERLGITAGVYLAYLFQLKCIYGSLERSLQVAREERSECVAIDFDALHRTCALENDIAFFREERTASNVNAAPYVELSSTRQYSQRLSDLASSKDSALCLVAHAYVRYLGDLFGGQIIARHVCETFDLNVEDRKGLAFYNFSSISSVRSFVKEYKQTLDEIGNCCDERMRSLIAQEAQHAFRLNILLFDDMESQCVASTVNRRT